MGGKAGLPSSRLVQIPKEKLKTLFFCEIIEKAMLKICSNKKRVYQLRNLLFQALIPSQLIRKTDVVIGFDTASSILGARCRALGRPFLLDQTAVSKTTSSRWAVEMGRAPDQAFEFHREQKEIQSSDALVVASTFCKESFLEAAKKIHVNPYGTSFSAQSKKADTQPKEKTLKLLFAGNATWNKGIRQLEQLWNLGKRDWPSQATLTVAGAVAPELRERLLSGGCKVTGRLLSNDLQQLMASNDILLFPSLYEGFGLVVLEAMAQGMVVLGSMNSGARDVIQDGLDGFLFPAGEIQGMAKTLADLMQNPDRKDRIGRAASEKAKRFTWEAYGKRYEQILSQTLRNHY